MHPVGQFNQEALQGRAYCKDQVHPPGDEATGDEVMADRNYYLKDYTPPQKAPQDLEEMAARLMLLEQQAFKTTGKKSDLRDRVEFVEARLTELEKIK